MKRRDLLLGLASVTMAGGCAQRAPSWIRAGDARYSRQIALPAPVLTGTFSLEQAISSRRSMRSFKPNPLPMATIGQLLWAGQGITSTDGKRAAPSAGALYPLELYVVTAKQIMHYLPRGHRVEIRDTADLRAQLQTAAFGQDPVGAAPVVLVVAAALDRTSRKYGARARAFVDREAGHAAQNILLQATAYGLAVVPIGSIDPARAATALALTAEQTVLYLIPVGVLL